MPPDATSLRTSADECQRSEEVPRLQPTAGEGGQQRQAPAGWGHGATLRLQIHEAGLVLQGEMSVACCEACAAVLGGGGVIT